MVITGAGRCLSAGVDLPAIVDGGAEYTDRFMTSLSAPAAYAMTKEQLHRPARYAIDAGAQTDEVVRACWMSEETLARITAYMKSLQ